MHLIVPGWSRSGSVRLTPFWIKELDNGSLLKFLRVVWVLYRWCMVPLQIKFFKIWVLPFGVIELSQFGLSVPFWSQSMRFQVLKCLENLRLLNYITSPFPQRLKIWFYSFDKLINTCPSISFDRAVNSSIPYFFSIIFFLKLHIILSHPKFRSWIHPSPVNLCWDFFYWVETRKKKKGWWYICVV